MFGDIIGVVTSIIPGVGGVVGIAGAAFGIYKKRQLGKVVKEVFEVVTVYRKAKEDGTITPEEMDKLLVELEEAVVAVIGVWKVK